MADYDLYRLSSQDFEHLIQALAIRIIAPGVSVFGAGPDGAREATFEGPMNYPSELAPWKGYLVLQCKHRQRPAKQPSIDAGWALTQFKKDLDKFLDPKRKLRPPEYYIAATNLVLSPGADDGGKDRLRALLEEYKPRLGLKGYDIWDYDQINRYLDTQPEVRKTYAAFIIPGDVLHAVCELLGGVAPDFEATMQVFLQSELLADQYARFERTSAPPEERIPLSRVFTDLSFTTEPREDTTGSDGPGLLHEIIKAGSKRLSPSILAKESPVVNATTFEVSAYDSVPARRPVDGRYVLVGGPGQGKSTIVQFICQLYRAALLHERPQDTLEEEARRALVSLTSDASASELALPSTRRFPIRIDLNELADQLSSKSCSSILDFVAQRISRRAAKNLAATALHTWLRLYPWAIVLDGLDEVPATSNRQMVLQAVRDFIIQAKEADADLLIVATTRPQGYNDDFGRELYRHLYLLPLSQERALKYARRLCDERYGREKVRADKVFRRIEAAFEHEATRRLLRSPLQVTMLAALVDKIGQPPEQRWKLFSEYFRVVYERETSREVELARILSDHASDIEAIHQNSGIALQLATERAGSTDSTLTKEQFNQIVEQRLREEGMSGNGLRKLQLDLTEAAMHRLVFLVPVREDRIGFEIRSLQEFMAGEAMLDGSDDEVATRLEAMASHPHWRNVFLFAAGKCFSDTRSQRFRSNIIRICERQNDVAVDAPVARILAGSRLALELLEEGIARSPKFHAQLAEIALRLLELPADIVHDRLAAVFSPGVEPVYRAHIERSLSSTGTWALLNCLLERGYTWATTLADQAWPSDPPKRADFLRSVQRPITNSWGLSRIIEVLPTIDPWEVDNTINIEKESIKILPGWAQAAIKWVSSNESRRHDLPLLTIDLSDSFSFKVRFCSIADERLKKLSELESMPPGAPAWNPLREAARFLRKPSAATLADALERIADTWSLDDGINLLAIPWPLGACLVAQGESLKKLAESANAGRLGDFDTWAAAEARQSVTFEEVFVLPDGALDLPSPQPRIPIACCGYSNRTELGELVLRELIDRLCEISAPLRPRYAELIVDVMTDVGFDDEIQSMPLTPSALRELIDCQPSMQVRTPALWPIGKRTQSESLWIEFLNWLGNQTCQFIYYRDPRGREFAAFLERAYNQDPARAGVLRLLALGVLEGYQPDIDPVRLSLDAKIEPRLREAALLVRLALPCADCVEGECVGRVAVELASSIPDLGESIRAMFEGKSVAGPWYEVVFMTILEHAPVEAGQLRAAAVELLYECISGRKQPLSESPSWNALNLPLSELMED